MLFEPVHVDARLIAIDKPAGLLSVPGRGSEKQDCAWSRLREQFPEALVVHRLDQATSGLLIFARSLEAQKALSQAFEQRQVRKTYQALVWGQMPADEGEINLPLAADWPNRPRQMVCHARGRPSQTHWRCMTQGTEQSRLALQPITGRSHQLRVHLLAMGHPIVGDALYDAQRPAARLMLHAEGLEISGLP